VPLFSLQCSAFKAALAASTLPLTSTAAAASVPWLTRDSDHDASGPVWGHKLPLAATAHNPSTM
jgi:hypothetical protein